MTAYIWAGVSVLALLVVAARAAGKSMGLVVSNLDAQVQLVISGGTSTSSSAGTPTNSGDTKPGVLSPEHSRWLMGFPAAWGCCGATAMRSCRKSRRRSSKPTAK